MDTDKVIQDLNRRFAAPLPEFYKRRIIFWYDEDREFEDKLEDIEIADAKPEIVVNDAVKNIIKAVDVGNMIDESTFEDRFGVRLYLSELSTGCKAAICVALMPDQMIDLQECGLNARDAISMIPAL